MKLDPTFLTMHPRTARWQEERKTCEACAHVSQQQGDTAMRCTKMAPPKTWRPLAGGYCIDAREIGMPCGHTARLFTPKETTA